MNLGQDNASITHEEKNVLKNWLEQVGKNFQFLHHVIFHATVHSTNNGYLMISCKINVGCLFFNSVSVFLIKHVGSQLQWRLYMFNCICTSKHDHT